VSFIVYFALASIPGTIAPVIFAFVMLFNVAWGVILMNIILTAVKEHVARFYELENILMKKQSFRDQMVFFKKEMQSELLDKYREFEENMMESIKDSGYHQVLTSYNNSIKFYLTEIHGADRKYNTLRTKMFTNQSDTFGYAFFLPKKFQIK
jgi:hypothetical protein